MSFKSQKMIGRSFVSAALFCLLILVILVIPVVPGAHADPALAPLPAVAQPTIPGPTAPTMQKADSAKSMQDSVRSAVSDSESRLGRLEPWQKKIFDDEVVPQSQKFVSGFSGNSAIVDLESIRNYLRFYGPTAFHGGSRKTLVYFRTAAGCEACAQGRDRIQAILKARLERRGLEPVWLTPEEAEGQGITGSPKQVADRLLAAARSQGDNAGLTLLIDPVPVDDLDSAHADEKHYLVRATFDLRDISREEGQIEVLDTEPFEAPVARLLNDAFTDVGAKLAKLNTDAGGPGGSEVRIEVRGTGDFPSYARARDALAEKLRADGSLEEREVARGRAVFALITNRSPAAVRKELSAPIGNGALALVPGGATASDGGSSASAPSAAAAGASPAGSDGGTPTDSPAGVPPGLPPVLKDAPPAATDSASAGGSPGASGGGDAILLEVHQ